MRRLVALAVVLTLAGACTSFTPASYVQGLRVLAVQAEPPELAAGESGALRVLAVDIDGLAVTVDWRACLLDPGYATIVNPLCLAGDAGPGAFLGLDGGAATGITMPQLDVTALGLPDSTGGLYLPLRVDVAAGGASIETLYRLRYGLGLQPPNHNPALAGVFLVTGTKNDPAAVLTPLDEASPPVVHLTDKVLLRATFTPDSAETYQVPTDLTSGATTTVTEILQLFWYATAGDLSDDQTGGDRPDSELTFKVRPPAAGATVDLYVVGRDERGGTDWAHRAVVIAP
jgi:hypothetical protein